MKISTRGRYGLRAIIDLAMNSKENCISLAEIAERQDISSNYLESIFAYLKRAGLVVGMAGSQGGYRLTKKPEQITLAEVLSVLEGDMSICDHLRNENPPKLRAFLQDVVWDEIDKNVETMLETTTIEDMIEQFNLQKTSSDCAFL